MPTAEALDQRPGDREPEARAVHAVHGRPAGEALEQLRHQLVGHAVTVVGHRDHRPIRVVARADAHGAPAIAVRVGEEVHQHLLQAVLVGQRPHRLGHVQLRPTCEPAPARPRAPPRPREPGPPARDSPRRTRTRPERDAADRRRAGRGVAPDGRSGRGSRRPGHRSTSCRPAESVSASPVITAIGAFSSWATSASASASRAASMPGPRAGSSPEAAAGRSCSRCWPPVAVASRSTSGFR